MERYISEQLEQQIVAFLQQWESGELGQALSWAKVAKASGYTRQALSANRPIRDAFNKAKQALKDPKKKPLDTAKTQNEILSLREENARLAALVLEHEKRFMRWAHNCQSKGINLLDLDKPIGVSFKLVSRTRGLPRG